jgi:alpha-L-fucosidase
MIAKISARGILQSLAACMTVFAALAVQAAEPASQPELKIAAGPFQPSWESLGKYQCPEWLRDAKFGMWAHWSAQCVPEMGDWYARGMYEQGSAQYKYHVAHYGHPSRFGFKDIDHIWKAEKWDPERLLDLYQRAGAKFFFALANHHDNFDCWGSKYHPWNSVAVGPHKDIVGIWAKAARARGMRFGVSVHASHAFRWFAVAHGSDKSGPLAGVPYDGRLTKAEGRSTWWEGLDPQQLYCTPPSPSKEPCWSLAGADQQYVTKFFMRTKDLIDTYRPDLFMFDDDDLPFGEVGLRLAAHFYNVSIQWHNGRNEAVINTRISQRQNMQAVVNMLERGIQDRLEPYPWETATCIGEWHYHRGIKYKTAEDVVRLLADVVSKNGVLVVNVPLRGDGSIDDEELKFVQDMAPWMAVNGEAIYGTRPWLIYGEGPMRVKGGQFNDQAARSFTAADIRFTTKGQSLYAIAMAWPGRQAVIRCLAKGSPLVTGDVREIRLLGHDGPLVFSRDAEGLKIQLPDAKPCKYAFAFKITGLKSNPAGLPAWEAAQKTAAAKPAGR